LQTSRKHRVGQMRCQKRVWYLFAILTPMIALDAGPARTGDQGAATQSANRFRGPVALALLDDGKTLLTANRRSGSLSMIDTATNAVTGEVAVGKQLSGLVQVPGRDLLLAIDEAAHELIVLAQEARSPTVVSRLPVAEYPVSVEVSRDGRRCFVASLWSRR